MRRGLSGTSASVESGVLGKCHHTLGDGWVDKHRMGRIEYD